MSDHTPDKDVPVASAGTGAGISARTPRYWISGGKLPATAGQRGKVCRNTCPGNASSNAADDGTEAAVSPVAISQLEAIRDQWIQPYVNRIGELEYERGRQDQHIVTQDRRIAEREDALAERDAEISILRDIPTTATESATAGNAELGLRSASNLSRSLVRLH